MKCAQKLGYLSVGRTELNGLWLRGQIAIVGDVQIAVSAWLNVGVFALTSERVRYLGAVNVWILRPSHPMKSLQLSLKQRLYGKRHGNHYITLSSE